MAPAQFDPPAASQPQQSPAGSAGGMAATSPNTISRGTGSSSSRAVNGNRQPQPPIRMLSDALVASNAVGQLGGGYKILPKQQAFYFVLDFYSKGLGKVDRGGRDVVCELAAQKFAPLLSCEHGQEYRRFEAQKVMILFDHVATADELAMLAKDVGILPPVELARALTEQAATIRTVLQRMEDYLVRYEVRSPTVKQRAKKSTMTALCGRHKTIRFILHDECHWRAQLAAKNAPGSGGEIVEWSQVGAFPQQQQSAQQSAQQSVQQSAQQRGKKRRRT